MLYYSTVHCTVHCTVQCNVVPVIDHSTYMIVQYTEVDECTRGAFDFSLVSMCKTQSASPNTKPKGISVIVFTANSI